MRFLAVVMGAITVLLLWSTQAHGATGAASGPTPHSFAETRTAEVLVWGFAAFIAVTFLCVVLSMLVDAKRQRLRVEKRSAIW